MTIAIPVTEQKTRVGKPPHSISVSLDRFFWHARAYTVAFRVLGTIATSLLFLHLYRSIERLSNSREPSPVTRKSSYFR